MVSTLNINGQVVGTAIFDGEKITATVTIGSPITATVNFGGGGVTVHNDLTGRSDADAHPIEAITGLTESLGAIPTELSELTEDANHRTVTDTEKEEWNGKQASLGFTPEDVSNKKTTLTDNDTDYPTSKVVTTELGKKQDSIKFTPEADPNSFASWVRGALLTGATFLTNSTILVTDTILSAFGKLQAQINALVTRVGKLEDNVIVDVTLTQDVQQFIITTDKNGAPLNLSDGNYRVLRNSYNGCNNSYSNVSTIFINDITSNCYLQSYANNLAPYFGINYKGGIIYSQLQCDLSLYNGKLSWAINTLGFDNSNSGSSIINVGASIPASIAIDAIVKVIFKDSVGGVNIKSGTRIMIIKL